jgi:two-component system sensor histidine kinase HydH
MPWTSETSSGADLLSFRRQESTLTVLGLAVLAALLVIHVGFSPMLGIPSRKILWTIGAFFLLQTLELLALQGLKGPLSGAQVRRYAWVSVWAKLLLAFAVALLGGFEDSHYTVLMVLPIAAAAFWFGLAGVLSVASAAVTLTFVELWLYYRQHPPPRLLEFYEAATLALTYFVVAIVVSALAGQIRRERARVQESLDDLERTKDLLVREEKLAALGRLSSAIAHEIRNPVAMIASSARLMIERGPDDPVAAEMREIVLSEARRLEKLTTDFLSYAHLREPAMKELSLSDTLSYVADVARARAAELGRTIRVESPADGKLLADPSQLYQALLDLVVNALEASPDRGSVILGATRPPGHVLLSVENQGEPIPPETTARLFEPFFTTKPRGTGLGLAIARSIARAHGGDVILGSNESGRIRFELSLPEAVR